MSNDNLNISSTQQPPKKKRKKSTYWLVKIPRWLGDEWFNDNKYQHGTQLGQFCAVPRDDTNTDELDIKLQISNPPSPINPKTQTSNSSVKQLEYIPIPSHFRMDEREKRHRINVKHGELQKLGADKLLLFHDKPSFPIGSKVEAFDASRLDQNHNDTDEEDDDITLNKKSTNTFNGYAKGVIKGINNDRTYTVEFDESHQQRYQVPEKDIRFIDAQQAKKANKCKLQGIIKSEMDVQPEWNKRYQDYLQKRAMNDKFCQKSIKIREKQDRYKMNLKPRSRVNKRKMKKMKAVRKDIEDYKNMIFAAFETKSVLTQIEIVRRCNGEKWAFLRPAVHIICDLHDRGANGRSWILKAEFRLNTDIV